MSITLRDYQEQTKDNFYTAIDNGFQRTLAVLGTGMGKTFCSCSIIDDFAGQGKQTLVLVERKILAWQWRKALLNINPELSIGVEMNTNKAGERNDVVVASLQTLGRKGVKRIKKFDPNQFDLCIADEAHRFPTPRGFRVLEYFGFGKENLSKDKLLLGLSVFPDSYIELKGEMFEDGWFGTIEEAWKKLDKKYKTKIKIYDYKTPNSVYSRGWDGEKFVWKRVKKFVRHKNTKYSSEVTFSGGSLKLTNDHSIYTINKGKVEEKETHSLKKSDTILLDNGNFYGHSRLPTVYDILSKSNKNFYVKLDLKENHRQIINPHYKKWWRWLKKKEYSYLPFDVYYKHRDKLPKPYYIYYEGAKGHGINPQKFNVKSLLYLMGLWLGDGWVNKAIGFSIENKYVSSIKNELENIKGVTGGIVITENNEGCKDIRFTNTIILEIFKYFFNGQKHYNKTIHNKLIFGLNTKEKKEIIRGLIDSDGHIKKKNKRNKRNVTITTTSEELKNTLSCLLRSINVNHGIYETAPKKGGKIGTRRIIGTRTRFDIKFSLNSFQNINESRKGNRKKYKNINCREGKIKNVSPIEYSGYVYDLEMEGHPSFVANGVLVHNTATSTRTDGISLGSLFDDVIADFNIVYGQQNGWLTHFDWTDVDTGVDVSDVDIARGDYVVSQLSDKLDKAPRNELIVKSYFDQLKGEKALCYSVNVEHAYHLEEAFLSAGIEARVVEAKTDKTKRKEYEDGYRQGQIKVLINHSVYNEGADFPETKGLLLTRGIVSPTTFTQTVGRGVRPPHDAFVDYFEDANARKESIERSSKPRCKVLDFHDHDVRGKIQTIATLYGYSPTLRPEPNKKKDFKEVVEVLERTKKEKGVDVSKIGSLDEIEMITSNRSINIKSFQTPPEIKDLTDRKWLDIGNNSYEIIYQKNSKTLIIEKDRAKDSLIDKDEWNLIEYDSKQKLSKKLNTFQSLGGAFKVADEYADRQGWEKQFLKRAEWMSEGVSEAQFNIINKVFRYKNGGSKFRLLNERYEDTGLRKIFWKDTKEILDKGTASAILTDFFNR